MTATVAMPRSAKHEDADVGRKLFASAYEIASAGGITSCRPSGNSIEDCVPRGYCMIELLPQD